jgi:uncharacterized protein with FMN-binding domain
MIAKIFNNNLFRVVSIVVLIVLAATAGKHRVNISQHQMISDLFADTSANIEFVNDNKWIITNLHSGNVTKLYIGNGNGYNGQVSVVFIVDSFNIINSVVPISQNETYSFFQKLEKGHFYDKIVGQEIMSLINFSPIDAISGATISSEAILQAIHYGYAQGEGLSIEQKSYPVFGLLELLIIILLFGGYLAGKIKNPTYSVYMRWIIMLIAFIVLGFVYNQHITLSRFSALLSGYFPDFYNELYFYLLTVISFLMLIITNKNVYCNSVCPFGVAQELLSKTGNAKPVRPKYHKALKWVQSFFVLGILLISLVFNNPSIAQYEVFGAFFQLTANTFLFGLLFVTIIISLFIKKPWCNYLCPIDRVFGFVKLTRNAIIKKS